MQSSSLIGPLVEVGNKDAHGRTMDPANDFYPRSCVMTRAPSVVVYGTQRLLYALAYLKIDRIRDLLAQYWSLSATSELHDDVVKNGGTVTMEDSGYYDNDYKQSEYLRRKHDNAVDVLGTGAYDQNILHLLCSGNTGGNMCIGNNRELYENILRTILRMLPPTAIRYLQTYRSSSFRRTPLEEAIWHGEYGLAMMLIKYGAPAVTDESTREMDTCKAWPICTKPEAVEMMRCTLNGLSIHDCPITLQRIKEPIVLDDGSVYEKQALLSWFIEKPVNMAALEECKRKIRKLFEERNNPDIHEFVCGMWTKVFTYVSPVTNAPLLRHLEDPIAFDVLADKIIHLAL